MRFDTRACFSPRAVFDLRLYVGPGRMTRSRTRSGHEKRKMQDQRWPACCSHEKHGFFVCSDRHPPRPVLYLGAKPGLTTGALSRASSSGILRLIDCWTVAPPGLSPCLHSSGLIFFGHNSTLWPHLLHETNPATRRARRTPPLSGVRPKAVAIPPSPWDRGTTFGRGDVNVELALEPGLSIQKPSYFGHKSITRGKGQTSTHRTAHTNIDGGTFRLGIESLCFFRYSCITS